MKSAGKRWKHSNENTNTLNINDTRIIPKESEAHVVVRELVLEVIGAVVQRVEPAHAVPMHPRTQA